MDITAKTTGIWSSRTTKSPERTCWWNTQRCLAQGNIREEGTKRSHMQPCWWSDLEYHSPATMGWLRPASFLSDTPSTELSLKTVKVRKCPSLTINCNRKRFSQESQNALLYFLVLAPLGTFLNKCSTMPRTKGSSKDWMKLTHWQVASRLSSRLTHLLV